MLSKFHKIHPTGDRSISRCFFQFTMQTYSSGSALAKNLKRRFQEMWTGVIRFIRRPSDTIHVCVDQLKQTANQIRTSRAHNLCNPTPPYSSFTHSSIHNIILQFQQESVQMDVCPTQLLDKHLRFLFIASFKLQQTKPVDAHTYKYLHHVNWTFCSS